MFKANSKLIFLVLVVVCCFSLNAQNTSFWANSPIGGLYNEGFIYRTNSDGTGLTIAHHFDGDAEGERPFENLITGPENRLYGLARGGINNSGIIFSIGPEARDYQIHHHFDGMEPSGSLMYATNGNLYGFDGTGYGNIFEYEPGAEEVNIIHTFDRQGGRISSINNRLIEAEPNVLLGVATRGSSIPNEDAGVIFKFNLNTREYHVLYEFDGSSGFRPESINFLSEGKYFGVTSGRWGSIFEFDYTANEVSLIYSFPSGFNGLITQVLLAGDGQYYGVTGTGGEDEHGSIFRYNPGRDEFETLHSFMEFEGPHIPEAPLIEARNGRIYGTATYVSRANAGVVIFELNPETGAVDYPTLNDGLDGISIYQLTEFVDESTVTGILDVTTSHPSKVYPNPTMDGKISFSRSWIGQSYQLMDLSSKAIDSGILGTELQLHDVPGVYVLILPDLGIQTKISLK